MTSLTEGSTNLLRDGEVFSLDSHSLKPDRVAAHSKLLQFLFVTFSAFFGEDHRFLVGSELMIDVTGHTMGPFFLHASTPPMTERALV